MRKLFQYRKACSSPNCQKAKFYHLKGFHMQPHAFGLLDDSVAERNRSLSGLGLTVCQDEQQIFLSPIRAWFHCGHACIVNRSSIPFDVPDSEGFEQIWLTTLLFLLA